MAMAAARRPLTHPCLPILFPPPPQMRSPSATHRCEQRATIVNSRIKWAKHTALDAAVARERHLRPTVDLVHAISAASADVCGLGGVPVHQIPSRRRLGLPGKVPSTAAFMRRYPAIFHVCRRPPPAVSTSTSRPFRWFGLTPEAAALRREEAEVLRETEPELVDRLRKLLMLAAGGVLPLPVVDQLRWDLGLPLGYRDSVLPRYPQYFHLEPATSRTEGGSAADERPWLRLLCWDARLAVSRLQTDVHASGGEDDGCLAFPVRFPRGFGLKKKWMAWLEEWQRLPYTCPYDHDAAGQLDPRTDVAEKRVVAVFHELLHLTVGKKTERANLSNLRRPLGLPYKFTKVFARHPGVFYLSPKLATQTVVLREAYGGGHSRGELVEKHPLVGIRERYAAMMRMGREGGMKGSIFESEEEEDAEAVELGTDGSNLDADSVVT